MIWLSPIVINDQSVRLPISSRAANKWTRDLAASIVFEDHRALFQRIARTPSLLVWCAARLPGLSIQPGDFHRWLSSPTGLQIFNGSDDASCENDIQQNAVEENLRGLARKYKRSFKQEDWCIESALDLLASYLGCFSHLNNLTSHQWLARTWIGDFVARFGAELVETSEWKCRIQEIGTITETLRDFDVRLHKEKLASMKQLAYGASHEINNPLANIASRAQMLASGEPDPERKRRLDSINQQAFRAHEMIADMMLFAHPPKAELIPIEAFPVVEQVVNELQSIADSQNTSLTCSASPMPEVLADATQLGVAVKAVITNSLEAVKQDGDVHVEMGNGAGELACISIRDSGPGFDERTRNHLFDPFFSGREAGRGLGFGLSKAWRIAQLHGGKIEAENQPHSGAVVHLRIPYAKAG